MTTQRRETPDAEFAVYHCQRCGRTFRNGEPMCNSSACLPAASASVIAEMRQELDEANRYWKEDFALEASRRQDALDRADKAEAKSASVIAEMQSLVEKWRAVKGSERFIAAHRLCAGDLSGLLSRLQKGEK